VLLEAAKHVAVTLSLCASSITLSGCINIGRPPTSKTCTQAGLNWVALDVSRVKYQPAIGKQPPRQLQPRGSISRSHTERALLDGSTIWIRCLHIHYRYNVVRRSKTHQ